MALRTSWVSLCELSELIEGRGKHVEIDGFSLAVFLLNGRIHIIDNYCPHAGGALAEGEVHEECVVCPWHGWAFRLESGQHAVMAGVKVRSYRSRRLERAGFPTLVQVELP